MSPPQPNGTVQRTADVGSWLWPPASSEKRFCFHHRLSASSCPESSVASVAGGASARPVMRETATPALRRTSASGSSSATMRAATRSMFVVRPAALAARERTVAERSCIMVRSRSEARASANSATTRTARARAAGSGWSSAAASAARPLSAARREASTVCPGVRLGRGMAPGRSDAAPGVLGRPGESERSHAPARANF
jgi:hypothetical protein